MTNQSVQVGLVQMPCSPDSRANLDRAAQGIKACASQGAQIVCLQELVATEYFCFEENYDHFDLAEAPDGPTVSYFTELARELKVVIVVPFFERRASGLYHNSAAVIDADGTNLGIYRKMHIPDDPGFLEKFYFSPGDLGFRVFDTHYGKISVLICWDQWFPEGARLAALAGAQIIFYPTAIGWHPTEPELREKYASGWEISMRAHAIANGSYVAAVNRTGNEGDMSFWGRSFVAGPMGEILAQAPEKQGANLVVSCDLRASELMRREWPFFRDRRVDAYTGIGKRFIDE
ncbi:MAG: carbon-nitrogen hydrolase [Myxococcota bacterium]|nr:carbon-nitrogen hydrolase [Myxococcota bacterium]